MRSFDSIVRSSKNSTAALCASILMSLALAGCQKSAGQPSVTQQRPLRKMEVSVTEVVQKNIALPVEFVGNLLPRRRTIVVAEVEGVVRSIPASGAKLDVVVDGKRYTEQLGIVPGQRVQANEVLVELDPTDYELALVMAKSKLAKVQAELARTLAGQRPEEVDRLRAARDEARARHNLAMAEFERVKELREKEVVTESEYDRRATETETAKAVLASAEAAVRAAEAGPTKEEIAVDQAAVAQAEAEVRMAEDDLSKTSIHAPYDGVITEIYVDVGDRVSPAAGSKLMELLDLRYLIAEVGVPEAQLGRIKLEDRATMKIAGTEEAVPAIVVAVNGKVEPETRNFRVRVAMDNSSGRFKAGQFAVVRFDMAPDKQTVTVPSRAITFAEGLPHVFVYAEGRVASRSVEIGLAGENDTEILSGVVPGEIVVVDDPAMLTDGMAVELRAQASVVAAHDSTADGGVL